MDLNDVVLVTLFMQIFMIKCPSQTSVEMRSKGTKFCFPSKYGGFGVFYLERSRMVFHDYALNHIFL